jgi:hypothetical protein
VLDEFLAWNSFVATLERSRTLLQTYPAGRERAQFAGRTHALIVEMKSFGDDPAKKALELAWRAVKVLNIAESRRGAEAVGLLERARSYADAALAEVRNEDIVDPPSLGPWAEELMAAARKARVIAIAQMNDLDGDAQPNAEKQFLEDLESFQSCAKLVEIPPKARLVVPKPIIWNLSLDYLQYPKLEAKAVKSGWFKFF